MPDSRDGCERGLKEIEEDSEERLSLPEAARLLGKHPQTVRSWIYSGFLRAQKGPGPSGRFIIKKSDLLKAIEYNPPGDQNGK